MADGGQVDADVRPAGDQPALNLTATDQQKKQEMAEELLSSVSRDPYDEDQAELRFLYSKPTCFIVFGKPGCGKTTLAKRLSQEWKCQMVNATEVIQQAIEMQTEMGIKAQEILLRGEAIPEDMAAKFIEDKVNSPEVAHHGYVLDGFPSISEDYMSIKNQLELVKNWKLKPDFIINLKMPDKDLENRRVGQKVDPNTGEVYTKEIYDPDKSLLPKEEEKEGEEEEEEEEELEEEEEATGPTELAAEVLERLIKRPEDLTSHVNDNISQYKSNVLRILEDYIADHDQQYLIELDANKPITILQKELMSRLACFVLRPAAVPIRLQDAEDDEIPEDIETDELMRNLAAKQMVAPRYRWRRSKWLRHCPVALAEGNLLPGKPEFGVSFLDKIYVMSSDQAMGKFLKNPRPYLLPPQPRPPCKLIVTGPELSGKTTFCHALAQKYGAKVLNMDEIIKPKLAEEKQRQLDQIRDEATENAINVIRNKIKDQMEAEQQKDETGASEADDTAAETEREADGDAADAEDKDSTLNKTETSDKEETDEKQETETESVVKTDLQDESSAGGEETAQDAAEGEKPAVTEDTSTTDADKMTEVTIDVDSTHHEVVEMVKVAVEAAVGTEVTLTPEAYIEVMEAAIQDAEKELRHSQDDGPLNGGWILDNFPKTRDQWTVMLEKNLVPDDVIVLRDESEHGDFLNKRWYQLNKQEVDTRVRVRIAKEAEEKRLKEEAEKKRLEEERMLEEEAMRQAKEEERQRRLEAGELSEEAEHSDSEEKQLHHTITPEIKIIDTSVEEGEGEGEKEDGSPADGDAAKGDDSTVPTSATPEVSTETPDVMKTSEATPPSVPEGELPEGPEVEAQRDARKNWDNEWASSLGVITGSSSVEPIGVDVCVKPEDGDKFEERTNEEILTDAVLQMERSLQYQGWELQGMDIDEEEEDADADQEEEEEEAEEEEDPNRATKKQLGDVNYFCPVALKETGVLWPGNPEVAAKYRERLYYFSNSDARDKFLVNPSTYLPKDKPFNAPPIRLLALGPKGAGKSLHGRNLAKKLGLFHIQFRERLQELIIAKTKKKIGPEFEEEQDDPDEPEEEEEEEDEAEEGGAITAPDGSKVDERSADNEKAESNMVKETSGVSAVTDAAKEEEEEEEVQYTEDEEAIIAYLKDDEALPNELLDKIVAPWWNEEPFKSTGFILEGFPRNTEEAAYMSESGLYPDAAVILAVEDTDIIGRLLPPKLDKWRKKMAKKLAKRQKIKDKKQKKREAAMAKRRAELQKEMDEKKAERRAERLAERGGESEDEDDEDEDDEEMEEEDDIEAMLAEEFEEEEEEEEDEDETEDDATDRMRNDLEEVYDNDTNRLAAVQDKLEELLVPRIELDAGRKPHIVRYLLTKRLKNIVQFRHSLFERVYPINERLALRMLQTGYKQPSRFGRWCPVKVSEGDCIQPMHGPGFVTYPAIYRQHIYFLSSLQAREQFSQDPMTFLRQPSPKPVVPIRLAIIGPPKSGKTTLANRFADEFGMVRLSIGEAIRIALDTQPKSELTRAINAHLFRGLTVPDELAVAALEVALMDMRCQTRGYVLDGFPVSKKQVDLLTKRKIIPVRVLEMQLESKQIVIRSTYDRYAADKAYTKHDSTQILAIKLASWLHEVDAVREWYTEEHANLVPVDADRSKWWVWDAAVEAAKDSVHQIQTYLQRIGEGKAAGIADMCITPREFVSRLGDFGQYCPVALAEREELVDCSVTKSLKFAVEFRGHYYKTGSKSDRDKFLGEPEKYVPPLAPRKLPPKELLPIRRTAEEVKAMKNKKIELLGYCSVTFLDGKLRYEAIVPGDPELVVEYREQLYYLESEEKLQNFMRQPEKYWNLTLPHKLPPKKEPLLINSLPMLGYMEQTVADILTKALTAVGNFKPKYPFLTPTRSSLVYVAYYLKAFNPKSSEYIRKKYKKKLQQYEDTCRLICYLGNNMTRRYRDPKDRPKDFDYKLETFVQLKDKEPTTTWVA